jgi:biopolymer transport protein ExbD
MRFRQRRHQIRAGGLDIAPFMNVFFVLLIFFMFSSSFIFQPGMRVNLPKAVTGEVVSQENVVITITKDDVVYLNERPINQDELTSNLGIMARDKTPLLIKADRSSSLGKIVEILDMCRLEGVSQVSLATVQESR